LWGILQERSVANREVVNVLRELEQENKLPAPLYQLILSYVHMVCNRIFLTKHRVHEMVVYDYLYKYYSKKLHLSTASPDDANKKVELIG
jgi:ABC-type oligopeptide transport system ATPase subunit